MTILEIAEWLIQCILSELLKTYQLSGYYLTGKNVMDSFEI